MPRTRQPKQQMDIYNLVFKGYVDYGTKHDKAKDYIDTRWIQPTGIIKDDIVMFDLDNKAEGEVILNILDSQGLSYVCQTTTKGYHVFLKNNFNLKKKVDDPNNHNKRVRNALTLPITTVCKGNSTRLYVDDEERKEPRPLMPSKHFNGELSDTPYYLTIIDTKCDFYGMVEGNRNEELSKYVLSLAHQGFTWEEAEKTIHLINDYVLGKSLEEREIKTILREDTKKKYEEIQVKASKNSKKTIKFVGLLDSLEIDKPKEYAFLVERLLYKNCVNLITGDPKTCKSLISNEIALSVALGRKAFNQWYCEEKGKVLLISPELDPRLRIASMAKGYGLNGLERLDINNIYVSENYSDVMFFSWQKYKDSLIEQIEQIRPSLIILDPLTYIFTGDITNSDEVGNFIKELKGICDDYDTTILLIHHNNRINSDKKINKISGSAAIGRFVDSIIYLQKPKDNEEQDFNKSDEELDKEAREVQLIKGEYRYGNEGYKYWSISFSFANQAIMSTADRIKNIADPEQEKLDRKATIWKVQNEIKDCLNDGRLDKKQFKKDEVLIVVSNTTNYSVSTYEKIVKEALKQLVDCGYLVSRGRGGYTLREL